MQSSVTSYTVDQYAISDDYAPQARRPMSSGRHVTLEVGDGTSESGKYVAADYAVLFWKADHRVGANCSSIGDNHKYDCYKTDYENNTDNCTASASLPAGFCPRRCARAREVGYFARPSRGSRWRRSRSRTRWWRWTAMR